MSNEKKDNPGVIAPPPIIFLAGAAASGFANWVVPVPIAGERYLFVIRIAGAAVSSGGLILILHIHRRMRSAKTNIEPWKPTTAIIMDGVFSMSRNPVYAGMFAIFFGLMLIFNSLWFIVLAGAVFPLIHFGVILREEKYLEQKFGEEYLKYKEKVGRWF